VTIRDIHEWDHHSDQPHVIRSRSAKRRLYLRGAMGSLKTLLTFLLALPPVLLMRFLPRGRTLPADASAVGLCVNIESPLAEKTPVSLDELAEHVAELGVDRLLVRVPLGEPQRFAPNLALAQRLSPAMLLIDVLQDREHIESRPLLERHLRAVFSAFSPLTKTFKIGNAVNRRKWAFYSLDEYFAFFAVAQRLRDSEFPDLELLGGSIIDFELPNFMRSLLHFRALKYDAVAALLYVDRRGAPESRQLGLDLPGKIDCFRSVMRLSGKCTDRLVITETNWPLLNTEPFAPAVGHCMVDEDRQAAYLARYYLLAFASAGVEAVYWHQLVAPGYGLIDNRGGVRKRKAYYALKAIATFFSKATIVGFARRGGIYRLTAERGAQRVTAVWTNDVPATIELIELDFAGAEDHSDSLEVYGLTGDRRTGAAALSVSGDVTYIVQQRS